MAARRIKQPTADSRRTTTTVGHRALRFQLSGVDVTHGGTLRRQTARGVAVAVGQSHSEESSLGAGGVGGERNSGDCDGLPNWSHP